MPDLAETEKSEPAIVTVRVAYIVDCPVCLRAHMRLVMETFECQTESCGQVIQMQKAE